MKTSSSLRLPRVVVLILFAILLAPQAARSDSATWALNPATGDWNTATNWMPNTVPNGPSDIASFDVSNTTAISLSADTTVDSVRFATNASAFTITASAHHLLTIGGAGLTNFSSETQIVDTSVDELGNYARVEFSGNAVVTGPVLFNNEGATGDGPGGETRFQGFSSAGDSIFVNNGPRNSSGGGGHTFFHNYATAANATITNLSGVGFATGYTAFFNHSSADHGTFTNQGHGAETNFYGSSTAAEGTFINTDEGGTQFVGDHSTAANGMFVNDGGTMVSDGGYTIFYNGADAGNGTFTGNPGVNGGSGGLIDFRFHSTGGTARIMIYGNAKLDISSHSTGGLTIGSLEGDGNVILGVRTSPSVVTT
jgi:hypothetical protein